MIMSRITVPARATRSLSTTATMCVARDARPVSSVSNAALGFSKSGRGTESTPLAGNGTFHCASRRGKTRPSFRAGIQEHRPSPLFLEPVFMGSGFPRYAPE
jgi:hypothetical protein